MAVANMLKLKLIGVNACQSELLTALQKTGTVQLTASTEFEGGFKSTQEQSELKNKKERIEQALLLIYEKRKALGEKTAEGKAVGITYGEFVSITQKEKELLQTADEVKAKIEKIACLKAEILALENEINSLQPYLLVTERFSDFKSTLKVEVRLGSVDKKNAVKLTEKLSSLDLATAITYGGDASVIAVSVIFHESIKAEVDAVLSECAFNRCTVTGEFTATEKTNELISKVKALQNEIDNFEREIASLHTEEKDFKTLCDYYLVELEKGECANNFTRTNSTFYLEGFVPEDKKEVVEKALECFEGSIYSEYAQIEEGEFAPTLMKNNKVVSNFEFVTNLYSVPKYKEFDPNAVMGIFFAIFLGLMTADVGYGLIMVLGGLFFNLRSKRQTGLTKLASLMILAGIPTIIFGFAFDSWLGMPAMQWLGIMDSPIMPDPVTDNSLLLGISVPTLLLICLGLGVVHIMVSLCVVAYVEFKRGKILDGLFDGAVWAIFLAGLLLFVLCQVGVTPGLDKVAIGLLVGSVVVGALTAGRHQKGFGKVTKGFGAVYGLINYMSDILSYARLYGLMLSGAQIAQIVSVQLAVPMLSSIGGVGGVIVCVLIMFVGHAFNVGMGLLGAFIHDSRLQYVEFFSHFYTGDGELFAPLGSKLEHTYIEG